MARTGNSKKPIRTIYHLLRTITQQILIRAVAVSEAIGRVDMLLNQAKVLRFNSAFLRSPLLPGEYQVVRVECRTIGVK